MSGMVMEAEMGGIMKMVAVIVEVAADAIDGS